MVAIGVLGVDGTEEEEVGPEVSRPSTRMGMIRSRGMPEGVPGAVPDGVPTDGVPAVGVAAEATGKLISVLWMAFPGSAAFNFIFSSDDFSSGLLVVSSDTDAVVGVDGVAMG